MFLDLLAPRRCPGCGTEARAPCPGCLTALRGPPYPHRPDPSPPGLPETWTVAAFDGPARALLLAYKERGRLRLARPLGGALARAAAAARPHALVPVPTASAARRERGYDHLGLLARRAGRTLGVPVVPALRRVRATADQSALDATARAANVAAAFAVRPDAVARLRGRRVVLVDDLVTTGASLAEAARALRAAGVEPVAAAVVAARRRTGAR